MTEILSDETNLTIIEVSSRGKRLRSPVRVYLPRAERPAEKALQNYVIDAFTGKMPELIPFTFHNQTALNLAKYLLRHGTGSKQTLYQYIYSVYRFSKTINQTPDEIIKACKKEDGSPNNEEIQKIIKEIDEFIGDLKADDLAPGTIGNYVKGVKNLFKINGLILNLPFTFSKRVKYRDRAPTPEELQKVIEIADIREKVIVSILALSAIREGTLAQLEYRHVMKDLEAGVIPVHLPIESDIVKGKYASYDTFLGPEAVQYLKIYLDIRRKGTRKILPEIITPNSPLIRDSRSKEPKPITVSQIHRLINKLYKDAGLIKKSKSKRFEVRPHSLRKYFKTQMTALGTIDSDYIEYMMGHVINTYNDVTSFGVEFLRNLYANSGLSIRPKTKLNKIEMLKGVIMSLGLNPDEILSREAMTKPYRTIIDGRENEEQMMILQKTIKKAIIDEIKSADSSAWSMVARDRSINSFKFLGLW